MVEEGDRAEEKISRMKKPFRTIDKGKSLQGRPASLKLVYDAFYDIGGKRMNHGRMRESFYKLRRDVEDVDRPSQSYGRAIASRSFSVERIKTELKKPSHLFYDCQDRVQTSKQISGNYATTCSTHKK